NGLNANFAIGKPGTVVVLGGSGLERGKFPGSRFTAGLWINKERNAGIEVSYFFLRERAFDFQLGSSGLPGSLGIGIPYIDAIFGGEAAEPIAAPGFSRRGNVAVTSPSTMLGAEANLIYRPRKVHYGRLSLLAGLRYLDLMEQLTLMDTITVPFDNNGTLQKGQLFRTDQFSTRNQFYGAQAGARFDFAYHRLSLKVNGSMALGANRQSVRISGLTSDDADHLTFTGGLLAQVTNIGKYRRHELTVVPDVRANLGYNFNAHFRAFVGYDFLYLNKIVRPDEQIDRVVNFTRAPQPTFHGSSSPLNFGPLRPVFSFIESDFWAQGLSLGIQARF
ncbi:MAG TPA: BBP7 family outer membrane beta-barrel protein, partial [Pyrinomonadaceae bacterium]|nr:BBP7 family outer membrane beta-barrel protein [Pyrinomonadaceae bacterium]